MSYFGSRAPNPRCRRGPIRSCGILAKRARYAGVQLHRSIKLLLMLVVAFVAVELLLSQRFASGPVEWAGIAAAVIPIWLVYGFETVAQAIEAHATAVRYAGMAFVALGLCGLLGRMIWCGSTGVATCISEEPITAVIMATVVFGIALMVLSDQVPAFRRAQRAKVGKNENWDRHS